MSTKSTKIRKGDKVVVITGKDRNKEGVVLRVFSKQNRVVVEGVNMRIKHIKKTAQRAGEKVTYEAPMHISNVMLLDPETNKKTRIGYTTEDGKKKRVAKKSNKILDNAKS